MHKHLRKVGYDTVQINTFAYMKDRHETQIIFDRDPTMQDQFIEKEIQNLHESGFKVMLKPHIWIGGWKFDPDNWRSKIDFAEPKKREEWFSNYTNFIIDQAKLAESNNVEIFVVGTELVELSKYTDGWQRLIHRVRDVYSGELTYAAEGMNAKNIKFWNRLDYIGIDAYFPLSKRNNPDVWELIKGWEKYKLKMGKLSELYGKKIIFTEIGFKSLEGSTIKPWEWNKAGKVSQIEQANAYKATSIVFRDKSYLAGVFIWKYFTDPNSYERHNLEKGFTPYGKKAEEVISIWFNN